MSKPNKLLDKLNLKAAKQLKEINEKCTIGVKNLKNIFEADKAIKELNILLSFDDQCEEAAELSKYIDKLLNSINI